MAGRYFYWCSSCEVYTTSRVAISNSPKCSQCDKITEPAVVVYPDIAGFPESMSVGQRTVSSFLNSIGLTVDVEAKIGNRFADVYLPELNTVVEFDGPTHQFASVDSKRDEELRESGVQEIIHVRDTSVETLSFLRKRVEEISEEIGKY